MNKITEHTLIPISLLIVIIGGIVWLTNIHAKANYANQKLEKLEQAIIDIAEMKKDIEYIKRSVEQRM